jgi:hypothetical protein
VQAWFGYFYPALSRELLENERSGV